MSIVCELELNRNKEVFEFDKIAKQSNGSVLLSVGKAVVMASVVSEFDNPVSENFTPLTVQYVEKTYASAKIPGGFIKRESKPSEFETLTSRLIDRSLRPLFPQGYVYPTTITVIVLSVDPELDLQVLALNAASAALYTSNLPVKKSISGVRIAKLENEFVVNPTMSELKNSTLDLYIAGSKSELLMIEMKSISTDEMVESSIDEFSKIHNINDMDENELINAIQLAQDSLNDTNTTYEKSFESACKEMEEVTLLEKNISDDLLVFVRENYSLNIKEAIKVMAKKERTSALKDVAVLISKLDSMINDEVEFSDIYEAVSIVKKDIVRKMTVLEGIRADGRGIKDVRPISIDINLLPSAHSSCLFTRGETQALVVATLGGPKDGQMYEVLASKTPLTENFMVHYNFPGFSVGEAKPMLGVSRRELGHGNLGKRALESSIDNDFTDTVRLVSEILESNGSSSMATVCGGSLALKAAGVPVHSLVAGVAMGAMFEDDKYAILTDIMGLEDHDGDMDFKVAGTFDGITALQMDIKLGGISLEFLKEALLQAKEGRTHILNIMEEEATTVVPSDALPMMEQFKIDPSKVFSVIGKAGSVIREIIEKFEVAIDIDKDGGNVKVTGTNRDMLNGAVEHIKTISSNAKGFVKKEQLNFEKLYDLDSIHNGKVLRITDFGAFVELPKGGEGLLHISKISKQRVNNVSDILSENQMIEVKVLKVSKDRIELAHPSF
ncbi:MAG TPA: polyribonucleotide nucleotidyltransferase [Arcobacter sp.]|nr:polyribonucleotide nucleotidyltransferase [Arcobacter sp.]HIP55419.1 polyribonucleotide nucleotidyltransferase [Arcobacter sp.]